jgi:hypothetical protein
VTVRFFISLPLTAISAPKLSKTFWSQVLGRKFFHMAARVVQSGLGKGMRRWIREWNAGSKSSTRFEVRNMTPRKYSRVRRNTVTSAFRSSSPAVLVTRKRSASSMRTIAFHLTARWNIARRPRSATSAFVPSSLVLTAYRGLFVSSETLSMIY